MVRGFGEMQNERKIIPPNPPPKWLRLGENFEDRNRIFIKMLKE